MTCSRRWLASIFTGARSGRTRLGSHRQLHQDHAVEPYYVTTPIFYPSAAPHIGHLHSLVTADIFARHARLTQPSRPVHFLTGTDEHGLKIQKAARENRMEPGAFCDNVTEKFRTLAKTANISHTRFIRTTEKAHHDAVQHVWRELDAKGLIYKDRYEGWYSVSDETFYPESQITPPTTPGGLPTSTETGSTVEWSSEENYKFRLSAFRAPLLAHYTASSHAILPPPPRASVLSELSQPLEDLSISRPMERLHWGVPVPDDPSHTVYVWFDALTVYLTGAGYPDLTTTGAWPPALQIIGKDILRFHAIYFPAMLQALGLPLATTLLAHGHWTASQRKMSKSVGNVADPFAAMDAYGVDAVRFYLARVGGRFGTDVDWSNEQLDKHTRELESLVGNFLYRMTSRTIHARLATCASTKNAAQLRAECGASDPNARIFAMLDALPAQVDAAFAAHNLADALGAVVECLKTANAVTTSIQPWLREQPLEVLQASYGVCMETLRVCGIYLQAFVPGTAGRLLDALGVPEDARTWASLEREWVPKDVKRVMLFPPRK
ncbi:hypothetical protein PLICRDRAFT_127532 [Plicaturopsis crispa FD-325 SS-3]|nr:hypothetical protein PLICRDRAFT_127532 [Plicaturopsis crispa FD-325 SS-3]